MKLTVSPQHFEEIIKKAYSLDLIYLLKLIDQEYDISSLRQSMKIDMLYQTLIRKGLITDNDDKLTTLGKELLAYMETKPSTKLAKKKIPNAEFDEWWKAYPGTDTFNHAGKHFIGSRSLRQNKDECKIKFNKILLEGDYTAQDLIDALKYDVLQKKDGSVKSGNNKLSYMQNSLTYLNQRSYEPFIELIKEGQIQDGSTAPVGSTDI